MMRPAHELILTMIDSEVLRITDINQAVITAPAIGMDDGVEGHSPANYGLKRTFSAIRHHFCVNATIALEDAKDDRLARGAAAAFASDSARSKVAFINFNFAVRVGRSALAFSCNTLSHSEKDRGHCLARQSRQLGDVAGSKIHCEVAHDLPKFALRNFRPLVIAVY